MRPKLRTCSSVLLSALAGFAQAADAYYTIEQWPSDLNTLPCAAFVRTPNGGWGLAGTIVVKSSNEVVSESFYVKGNAVADIIEKKCGNPFNPLHLPVVGGTNKTIHGEPTPG
jgi:hypothetical protein